MPQFIIETNVSRSEIGADFTSKAIPLLASTFDRPPEYCAVVVVPDVLMSFGGSQAPAAAARVLVIDRLGTEKNKEYSRVLFELVERELGVPQHRMFITFQEKPASDFGYKGTTVQSIFG